MVCLCVALLLLAETAVQQHVLEDVHVEDAVLRSNVPLSLETCRVGSVANSLKPQTLATEFENVIQPTI